MCSSDLHPEQSAGGDQQAEAAAGDPGQASQQDAQHNARDRGQMAAEAAGRRARQQALPTQQQGRGRGGGEHRERAVQVLIIGALRLAYQRGARRPRPSLAVADQRARPASADRCP